MLKSPQHRLKSLKGELESLRVGPFTDESADQQMQLLIEIGETMEKWRSIGFGGVGKIGLGMVIVIPIFSITLPLQERKETSFTDLWTRTGIGGRIMRR